MPTVPLGKPPLGPNHREGFLVLLDDMPHGANQGAVMRMEMSSYKLDPVPFLLTEQAQEKLVGEL